MVDAVKKKTSARKKSRKTTVKNTITRKNPDPKQLFKFYVLVALMAALAIFLLVHSLKVSWHKINQNTDNSKSQGTLIQLQDKFDNIVSESTSLFDRVNNNLQNIPTSTPELPETTQPLPDLTQEQIKEMTERLKQSNQNSNN